METFEEFVQRLCEDIGCYYHLIPSGAWYSLKKYNSNRRGEMGVFGYIKKRGDIFIIDILERFAKDADVVRYAEDINKTINWNKPGIILTVNRDSNGNDYKKAVTILRAVMNIR